jgi:hypothetical protein
LIEHLHHDGWAEHLRRSFEVALDILSHDRFRRCSSSVDESNTLLGIVDRWLARTGMAPVRDTTDMN